MNNEEPLNRISIVLGVLGGKPITSNMRIAVEHVLGKLVAGDTVEDIPREYPVLEAEDIQACVPVAHRSLARELVHERIQVPGSS